MRQFVKSLALFSSVLLLGGLIVTGAVSVSHTGNDALALGGSSGHISVDTNAPVIASHSSADCESPLKHGNVTSPFLTKGVLRPVFIYSNVAQPSLNSYSQVGQDLVIQELHVMKEHELRSGRTEKYFIDLAVNDAIKWSNTLLFEQKGWGGLCIEPNPTYWYGLAAFRKCLILGSFVGVPKMALKLMFL